MAKKDTVEIWGFQQGSSVVEQGTHMPLIVGSHPDRRSSSRQAATNGPNRMLWEDGGIGAHLPVSALSPSGHWLLILTILWIEKF